jgi:hypothetical protein
MQTKQWIKLNNTVKANITSIKQARKNNELQTFSS